MLECGDMIEATQRVLSSLSQEMGESAGGLLAFHCMGRFMEARDRGELGALFETMGHVSLAGLNTFGEQYGALHVNHSMTGVMFG